MGRIDKVNQQLKRETGIIIQRDLNDPRLEFVSITSVDVSKDLRNAKIYFSVLGDESQIKSAHQGLDSARGMIKRLIGQRMNMRYTPDLIFYYDNSLEISARIEETLQEINNDNKENHKDD